MPELSDSDIVPIVDYNLPSIHRDSFSYHQWRDYLYKLQVGEIKLQSDEMSNTLGEMSRNLGQQTILLLAENSPSIFLRHSGIALLDEVPDQQVLAEASFDDKSRFFQQAFLGYAKHWALDRGSKLTNAFVVSSVTMASAMLNKTQEETIQFLIKTTSESSMNTFLKEILLDGFQKVDKNRVWSLMEFLLFSQYQFRQADEEAIKQAMFQRVEINGHEFSFAHANEFPIPITIEDEELLLPLKKSVHRGRKDMVEQARETAYQNLGIERGSLDENSPPNWWVIGEDNERLRSNEVLIYYPVDKPVHKIVPLFDELYKLSDWRPGWTKLQIDPLSNSVVGVYKLVP